MSTVTTDGLTRIVVEVELIGNTNVRKEPSRTSTILRVLRANEAVTMAGFTRFGEKIQGNSAWYLTQEGCFVWAGATTRPNPEIAEPALRLDEATAAPAPSGPVPSGITRIDGLLSGGSPALTTTNQDVQGVGAVQDLLSGQGFRGLPGLLSPVYGKFGPKTVECVRQFQRNRTIPETGSVDKTTLEQLVGTPATDPRLSQVYTTLVLGFPYKGMQRVLGLTAIMEGLGKFGSLNLNADKAGLSFGIIQWAQRPKRLIDILEAFSKADASKYVSIFGSGSEATAAALLAHVRKLNGGVDPKTGLTTDMAFDLTSPQWVARFQAAAIDRQYQQIQIKVALAAFQRSMEEMRKYASDLKTERTVAFLLDVANQCGDGGLRQMYQSAANTGATGMDLLEVIADETIERVAPNLQAGVRMRRDNFLTTPFLADEPFMV